MPSKPFFFAIATLLPLPLLSLAIGLGGIWLILPLIYMTFFTFLLDEMFELEFTKLGENLFAQHILPAMLTFCHFIVLFTAIHTLTTPDISQIAKVLLYPAFSLYLGMVSHSCAHELIHRSNRFEFTCGKWIFISLGFGHHTSAHLQVHHVYVGTRRDPNSARMGESLYTFLRRASIEEFRAGLRAEKARLKIIGQAPWARQNPFWQYIGGAVLFLAISALIGGLWGILAYLLLCGYAQLQMLVLDYVQHYGLVRAERKAGKFEPVQAQHSWNAPHWFSGLLTLNAPRHSDHHTTPRKTYTELDTLTQSAPQLPHSIPVMVGLAFWPSRWRKIMAKTLEKWYKNEHNSK